MVASKKNIGNSRWRLFFLKKHQNKLFLLFHPSPRANTIMNTNINININNKSVSLCWSVLLLVDIFQCFWDLFYRHRSWVNSSSPASSSLSSSSTSCSRLSLEEGDQQEASRSEQEQQEPSLSEKEVLGFAWQIAKGMSYLTDMRVRQTVFVN